MTRLTPTFSSVKTLQVSYANPQETILGTPETLPTSEPTTPQIGYTLQTSDMPTFSPFQPASVKYLAYVFGAGKFTTAGTLYWTMKKNGVTVATSSGSVGANTYYTVIAKFLDVTVGDTLQLSLWASVTGAYWDYKALRVVITRLLPEKATSLYANVKFWGTDLTLPSGSYSTPPGSPRAYHCGYDNAEIYPPYPVVREYLYPKTSTYGIWRIYLGDVYQMNIARIATSATTRPTYYFMRTLTQLQYRLVRF
ncbi:MAG: hypothetical protein QXZ51_00575 [Candidatus Bathyarchaeia archaeon]